MTFVQLVNTVLKRLREATVTNVTDNTYAVLIGEYVNEAKAEVEDAWNWKCLRTDVTFSTIASTNSYDLGSGGVGSSSTNERSRLLYDDENLPQVYDLTNRTQLYEESLEETRENLAIGQLTNAKPAVFSQLRSRTGVALKMCPAPDGAYSMQASFVVPQADLSANTDVLLVPAEPVWKSAYAKALAERSAGLGDDYTKAQDAADRSLADYIARDAESGELTLYPV